MEVVREVVPIRDYSNKKILAPMVRAGTLPFRLLALDHGADIVYSEETIALALRKTRRVINDVAGTYDYVTAPGQAPVYRTCAREHPNVIQLGVADPVVAVEAASIVSLDVNGVDVNMGCPKHFSIQGGMGAALLSKPEKIRDILTSLRRNVLNSITCKIRLLDSVSKTIDLLRMIEQTGVSAIAVHTREIHERPRDPAHWDRMCEIVQGAVGVPLIVNGDIWQREDIEKVKKQTGASSVMIARGALQNVSIFGDQHVEMSEIVGQYLKYCIDLRNNFQNIKYTVKAIIESPQNLHVYRKQQEIIHKTKTTEEICAVWNMDEYYRTHCSESRPSESDRREPHCGTNGLSAHTKRANSKSEEETPDTKKQKTNNGKVEEEEEDRRSPACEEVSECERGRGSECERGECESAGRMDLDMRG